MAEAKQEGLRPQRPTLRHRSYSAAPHLGQSSTADAFSQESNGAPDTKAPNSAEEKAHRGLFHDSRHHVHGMMRRHGDGSKANQHLHVRQHLHDLKPTALLHDARGPRPSLPKTPPPSTAPPILRHESSFHEIKGRRVTAAGIEMERRKADLREREVKRAFDDLDRSAGETKRGVNEAYDSVMDKVRILHEIVDSMQRMAEESKQLRTRYHDQAGDVHTDVTAQIDAFDRFGSQQATVEALEARITAGKQATLRLNDRLEAARQRMDAWEAREKQWQAKTSIYGWVMAIFVMALVAALVTWRQLTHSSLPEIQIEQQKLPDFIVQDLQAGRTLREQQNHTASAPARRATDLPRDKRLAGFDEL